MGRKSRRKLNRLEEEFQEERTAGKEQLSGNYLRVLGQTRDCQGSDGGVKDKALRTVAKVQSLLSPDLSFSWMSLLWLSVIPGAILPAWIPKPVMKGKIH